MTSSSSFGTGLLPRSGIGASMRRPDGPDKVTGAFPFASDLSAPGMLYGKTLRSPHPHALVRAIDVSRAESMPGVRAVLTASNVPGRHRYGLHYPDQPVLAGVGEEVQYAGEPVAIIAADHPEIARNALDQIAVDYEELPMVTDPITALVNGQDFRTIQLRHGPAAPPAEVVVSGYYEVGQQDQAPLGPEAGLAVPDSTGGVDLWVASQGLHIDQAQVAESLALRAEACRIHLAGVGGAFGAREDLSIHIHACMLALACRRPVKMWYGREESFLGHVHRHPALMWYEHGADRDGCLTYVRATIVLDGGAYASSSPAVTANAAAFSCGPYRVPSARIWCASARTNNAPNGAMRGFGAVQVCFGHESQMDKLAARLGMDPVAIRLLNALEPGDRLITGQVMDGSVPVADLIRSCQALALPDGTSHPLGLPGGRGNVSSTDHIRRGVGFALGMKNLAFSEGADDFSTARVRLQVLDGDPVAVVKTAAIEMGQGLLTVCQQVVQTELGVQRVDLEPADTSVGPAGSGSASRQTWMVAGALRAASQSIVAEILARAGSPGSRLEGGKVVTQDGEILGPMEAWLDSAIEAEAEFRHRPTSPLDENGQGDAHVAIMFVAQRAVADVDPDAGLIRIAQVATALDVGRAINPLQVHGQIEGGVAQGVGLGVMEEIRQESGRIINPSFTDYLLPTTLDMPAVVSALVESAEPTAPYGLKGVGEPPAIASPAAVCAAARDATSLGLARIPVRAEHLTGIEECRPALQVTPGGPLQPAGPAQPAAN